MSSYEYTVIPAPDRGEKTKGTKTAAERFSLALASELNRMAADGWDYVRAETLPTEERSGLTSRTNVYHNVLVFRRELQKVAQPEPSSVEAPFSQPMRMTPKPAATVQEPRNRSPDQPAPPARDDQQTA